MPHPHQAFERFRDGPQAKHVPRGQRGLDRGSIAVSLRVVFILSCPQIVPTGKFHRPVRWRTSRKAAQLPHHGQGNDRVQVISPPRRGNQSLTFHSSIVWTSVPHCYRMNSRDMVRTSAGQKKGYVMFSRTNAIRNKTGFGVIRKSFDQPSIIITDTSILNEGRTGFH